MKTETKDLIDNWIAFQRSGDPNLKWTILKFDQLTLNEPIEAWLAIKTIFELTKEEPDVVGILAAGPLEDLLAQNGKTVIADLEKHLLDRPDFKECLSGVWQNYMTDEFYKQLIELNRG